MSPPPTFDLYMAQCKREFVNMPVHWLLVTKNPNRTEKRCTYYHSTDVDDTMEYSIEIEYEKRFDAWGIEKTEKIGVVHEDDLNVIEFIALTTPPQRCQMWVCAVLKVIEQLGYVNKGTAAYWEAKIEPRTVGPQQKEIEERWETKAEPLPSGLVPKAKRVQEVLTQTKRKRTD